MDERGGRAPDRRGEQVRIVIEFDVPDPDRFVEMAEAMVAVSRQEPGTLVYDWYVDRDAHTGALYEAYASGEALMAHARGPVFSEIVPKYTDTMAVTKVDVYGASPELERMGQVLGAPTRFWGASFAAVTED